MGKIKVKNFSVSIFFLIGFSIIAHADIGETENGDSNENKTVQQPVVQSVAQPAAVPQETKTTKPKTVTQTIIDPPTTVVTYQAKTIEYADSDRDGLIDIEDPHPNIPEIYFVKDDNFNGIVDTFENYVAK
jgi:hypothetical protein